MDKHTWIAVLIPSLVGAVSEAGLSLLLFQPLERKWSGAEVRTRNRREFLKCLEEVRARADALEAALRDERMMKRLHYVEELGLLIRETRNAIDAVQHTRSAFQEDLKFFRKSYYDLAFVRWDGLYRRWIALGAPPCRGNVTAKQTALLLRPAMEQFREELELAVQRVKENL